MSLQIAVAHTGQRLDADPVGFHSIDALKQWISTETQIPPQDQILLTPRGKHVKPQALLTEKEIFVYDRELFNLSASQSAVPPAALPEPYTADDPPDTLASHTDLAAWQNLFKARRDWAFEVLQKSEGMSQLASRYFSEQATVEKGTQIAVGNHDTHLRNLEQKHQQATIWFDGVSKETGDNLRNLEKDYAQLSSIPANAEFIPFLAKGVRTTQKIQKASPHRITLQEFLDADAVKSATAVGKRVRESFAKRIVDMGSQIERISSDYNDLLGAVDQSQSRSLVDDAEEPVRLYNEILAVTKKVDSDYEHVMGLQANSRSVAQVSKMALLHTRNFLPAIKEYSAEMSDLVRRSVEQKNLSVKNALESMRSISNIESLISALNADLDSLDLPKDGLDALELVSIVSRLPYIYGSLMIEAIRRREWVEKMKKDTSSLAEEMAGFQEEEERRRKKWLKPISDVINVEVAQGNMLGFEMNVQAERNHWPTVSRDDLQEYITVLQSLDGLETASEPLNQALKELDRPTKQQIKRAKNFKMGSVHEPAFGKGSLMLRGDDEMRVLKEANAKLEEELKGSKSRIRRLEDLLHRQTHVSRLSIGSGFPSIGPQSPADPSTPVAEVSSPRPQEEISRRSSVSSRRFSSNQNSDERALTRRILKLEADLAAEKEARAALEKEAKSRSEEDSELRRQAEEANSNRKDIMENMEAQQKEFADERRALEQEIAGYKNKIDEAEDELDRILGSRDNERTGTDAKIQDLLAELEKTRKDAAEEVQRAHQELKSLRSDLERRKETDYQQYESLSAAFAHLSTDDVPEDHAALVSQLEELALRSMNHLKDLEQAVAMARAENESLRGSAERQQAEMSSKLDAREAEALSLREQLDSEKAKTASITVELEEERDHLRNLRTKFAEGETGSEALRQRVAEEEAQVGVLRMQLAESQSHANSLDVELMHLQKKMAKYEEVDASTSHQRSVRAKELSQRLYAQQERLLRLLETIGFVVTYENGAMAVQRASRVNSGSTVLNDMTRSTTTPSPTPLKRQLDDNLDLSFLQWPETGNPDEENRLYSELMTNLDRFDIETFSEAVFKRMRDMEHTARKYQREARAYRDKAHRFHSEAHEKIAFKSFKEGDLALFLPTRNQATRPWAAFNVGAPHYFLREQDAHKLHGREWLVARISKVEERVVDLSKAMDGAARRRSMDGGSTASEAAVSFEDDNPFELSDGLRWYLLDAAEEKPGAPSTPGLGKTTVASANVDAKGSIRMTKKSSSTDPAKTLGKSLDSRRSSGTSKKSIPAITNRHSSETMNAPGENAEAGSHSNVATRGGSPSSRPGPSQLRNESQGERSGVERLLDGTDEVRKDLLWGP
jgi:autophagy-related protein 11